VSYTRIEDNPTAARRRTVPFPSSPKRRSASLRASLIAASLLLAPAALAESQRSSVVIYVYGARVGQPGQEGCHDFRGDCIVFEKDKPVVLVNYTYDIQETEDSATIAIDLESTSSGARKALADLSKRHVGKRLAVVVRDRVINSPEVRNVLDQPALQLQFGDSHSFELVKSALAGDGDAAAPTHAPQKAKSHGAAGGQTGKKKAKKPH
jgi:hypothetical protein